MTDSCVLQGFTIPLDKRLAADGRGLQSVHINENFARLAEALYLADRKAREAVEMRAQVCSSSYLFFVYSQFTTSEPQYKRLQSEQCTKLLG